MSKKKPLRSKPERKELRKWNPGGEAFHYTHEVQNAEPEIITRTVRVMSPAGAVVTVEVNLTEIISEAARLAYATMRGKSEAQVPANCIAQVNPDGITSRNAALRLEFGHSWKRRRGHVSTVMEIEEDAK